MSAHMGVEAAPEPAGAAEPVAGQAQKRRIRNIKELRDAVEAELGKMRAALIGDLDVDINLYDALMDLSDKVMDMLYCSGGQYCRVDDAIVMAYDLARDIERVAEIAQRHDLARVGARVSRMIFLYAYEYEDMGGSDR